MLFILYAHLLGAILVGTILIFLLRDVLHESLINLPRYARLLSFTLLFEILTGVAMSLIAHSAPLLLCRNIMLYTMIIFAVLFFIKVKLTRTNNNHLFPYRFVTLTSLLGFSSLIPVFATLIL